MGYRELERALSDRRLDVTHVSIGRYERGKRVPGADYLLALSEMGGIDGHWLLTGEGEPVRLPEGREQRAFRKIARYIDAVRERKEATPDATIADRSAAVAATIDEVQSRRAETPAPVHPTKSIGGDRA